MPIQLYKDAAGLWWEERWRVVVEGVCNLSLNIILIQFWGIVGVLLSTVITVLLISFPWQVSILFKNYFGKATATYFVYQAKRFFIMIFVCALTFILAELLFINLPIAIALVVRFIFVTVFPNAMLYLIWHKRNEFFESKMFLNEIFKKVLKKC